MKEFKYWCDLFDDQLPQLFTLCKNESEDLFYICSGLNFVATIHQKNHHWQQVGGEEMPKKIIIEIGNFLEICVRN